MPDNCPDCNHGNGEHGVDLDGDHDESNCTKNGGLRIAAHDHIRDVLIDMLKQCGFKDIQREPVGWDYRRSEDMAGGDSNRKRPDIMCRDPRYGTKYIIDVTIA